MKKNDDAERLRKIFSCNLVRFMNRKGKTTSDISADLGISFSTVADWVHGRKMPRIDKIEMLADYFKVYKSDLIEEKPTAEKDDELLELIDEFTKTIENMSDSDKDLLIGMMRSLREKNGRIE